MNSSLNLFDYEKVGPEILQNCKIERKMASKNGLEKHTSESSIYDSINVCLHFV